MIAADANGGSKTLAAGLNHVPGDGDGILKFADRAHGQLEEYAHAEELVASEGVAVAEAEVDAPLPEAQLTREARKGEDA